MYRRWYSTTELYFLTAVKFEIFFERLLKYFAFFLILKNYLTDLTEKNVQITSLELFSLDIFIFGPSEL